MSHYTKTPEHLKGRNRHRDCGFAELMAVETDRKLYSEHMKRMAKTTKTSKNEDLSLKENRYAGLETCTSYISYDSQVPEKKNFSHYPYAIQRTNTYDLSMENFSFAHFPSTESILTLLFHWISMKILRPLHGPHAFVRFEKMMEIDRWMMRLESPEKNGCEFAPAKRRYLTISSNIEIHHIVDVLKRPPPPEVPNFHAICDRHGLRCCWNRTTEEIISKKSEEEIDSEDRTAESSAHKYRVITHDSKKVQEFCNAIRGCEFQRGRHRITQGLPSTSLRFAVKMQ